MAEHTYSEILRRCQDAEMILIGIGEKFQYNWDILEQNERYREIESEIRETGQEETYHWIIPFLQKMALEEYPDQQLTEAYRNLGKLVKDKNYFIISTVIDDCIYQYDFQEERIVTPCGGFRKMQCDGNCNDRLLDFDEEVYKKVKSYFNRNEILEELQEPICEQCGKKKRFNQLGTENYAEKGYLQQWERYTKWLQGTVNKKICVIELGVGMELPTVIRWPFEKIIYYNQKSFLYRIHPSLYQLGEKIGGRGNGIKENPVSFLVNGFVK